MEKGRGLVGDMPALYAREGVGWYLGNLSRRRDRESRVTNT